MHFVYKAASFLHGSPNMDANTLNLKATVRILTSCHVTLGFISNPKRWCPNAQDRTVDGDCAGPTRQTQPFRNARARRHGPALPGRLAQGLANAADSPKPGPAPRHAGTGGDGPVPLTDGCRPMGPGLGGAAEGATGEGPMGEGPGTDTGAAICTFTCAILYLPGRRSPKSRSALLYRPALLYRFAFTNQTFLSHTGDSAQDVHDARRRPAF